MERRQFRRALAALILTLLASSGTAPALASQEANIDHAETRSGVLRVLYSLPALPTGVELELDTLEVTIDGAALPAEADLATDASAADTIERTTILAIDASRSMQGERFEQAKAAARSFLEQAPPDVRVGIVAFAGNVETLHAPSRDRQAAIAVLDELTLKLQTRLYDGVNAAVKAAGSEGQRSLLVLSDGRDTSDTPLEQVIETISVAKVRVDVVALGAAARVNPPLDAMAQEGRGVVVAAKDPSALEEVFRAEAADLARQVLVVVPLPDELTATEGSLTISIAAGGESFSDSAFVPLRSAPSGRDAETIPSTGLQGFQANPLLTSPTVLWAGIMALGAGTLFVLLTAFGVFGHRDKTSLDEQLAAYTRAGRGGRSARHASASPNSVTESAIGLAQKALASSSGFETKLGTKLESANVAMRPAEWLLLHAGIALAAAAVGLMLSSGSVLFALTLLLVGAVLPYFYLGMKRSRRLKAFNSQLAETLQLISGSLSAGLSLAQSLDTVVREGSDPMAAEFRKVLVEARLGVQIEDALEGISRRMESDDFAWIVMAIRIQREVGGNLAELLLSVAATLRERDYLRRQVKTLSAEGRMSAWILSGLPPALLLYMAIANPQYLTPMLTTPLGWAMFGLMGFLLAIGSFWMSRVVKVDV